MPIQIQEINDGNEAMECPLCMEPFEVDDINFFPCACGYQICRFCWHRIRTDENGLCPACRTSYPENPAEFRPLSGSDLQKIKQEKRQKEVQRRQKLTDGRRHLAAIRVLQKNLVFVVGLSQRLSDPETLKRQDYFGKYGRIIKVVINSNTAYAGAQGPSCSAYVTYSKMEEALRAIQSVNNVYIDGRTLKASLGTTKYCSTYLKNQQCHKPDCMYLHELAEMESSFTKEDMQAGKHQELEQRLIEQMMQKEAEVAARVDSISSYDSATTSDAERNTTRPRHNSGSSSAPVQQTRKVENSWLSGSGELGLSSKLSSSLEEKRRKNTESVLMKTVTTSQHKDVRLKQDVEVIKNDSGGASSECSSAAVTPPPAAVTFSDAVTRYTETNKNVEATVLARQPNSSTDVITTEPQNHITTPNQEETTESKDETDLSQATECLSISKPEEPPNQYKPFQRFTHSDEEFTSLPLSYSRNQLLPGSTWMDNGEDHTLKDAIPISSSNDWEVAFGFGKPSSLPSFSSTSVEVDAGDDDLGFDPFTECKKGLADLIEKESMHDHHVNRVWENTGLSPPIMPQPHPAAFSSGRQQSSLMGNQMPPLHFGSKSNAGFSSGFSSNSNLNLGFNSQPNQIHRNDNFSSNMNLKGNSIDSSNRNGLNEWQNGLRALLPSVNINFAMDNNPATSGSTMSNQGFHNVPGFGRPPPPSQSNQTVSRARPTYSMGGYEGWPISGGSAVPPSQSSLFPNRTPPSLFHNGFGFGQSVNERYSPIAPPPGLGSSFHNDPAIISSGNKPFAPMPSLSNPPVEETPHWMKSLQTLTDTDSSMNPIPSSGFMPVSEQNTAPFSSWPSLTNPAMGGTPGQPPPGFQSRLPYTNNTEFGIRHSLLENQS